MKKTVSNKAIPVIDLPMSDATNYDEFVDDPVISKFIWDRTIDAVGIGTNKGHKNVNLFRIVGTELVISLDISGWKNALTNAMDFYSSDDIADYDRSIYCRDLLKSQQDLPTSVDDTADIETDDEQADKIAGLVHTLLGSPVRIKKARRTSEDSKRAAFDRLIYQMSYVHERESILIDYLDTTAYNDAFWDIIFELMDICFTQAQQKLIQWYVWGRYKQNHEEEIFDEKGDVMELETTEDLWNAIQKYK